MLEIYPEFWRRSWRLLFGSYYQSLPVLDLTSPCPAETRLQRNARYINNTAACALSMQYTIQYGRGGSL